MSKPAISGRRSLLLATCLTVVVGLSACDKFSAPKPSSALTFNAVDVSGADYARALQLHDVDGKPRSLAEFKGKVVFLFFGFTQCPDVCPTTMAELAEVRRRLGPDGERVQGLFVSVDPERDTPAVLKAYLQSMDPSFIGLTGTPQEIEQVGREFKIFYQKVPTKSGGYTIDHTAGAYVFDTDGQVRLFARYGMGVDALTADIRQLLPARAVGAADSTSGASPAQPASNVKL
ncbi:MAG TPA: SCO family protein [Aquabacterium sp.]|nr:SCO family protein [Aquabacterium sp.]